MQPDRIYNYTPCVWLALNTAEISTAANKKLFTIAETTSLSTTKKEKYTNTEN